MINRQGYETAAFYRIRVKGALDQKWSDWFGNLAITRQNGETLLEGQLIDQATLHGVLAKINELGLVILSVERQDK